MGHLYSESIPELELQRTRRTSRHNAAPTLFTELDRTPIDHFPGRVSCANHGEHFQADSVASAHSGRCPNSCSDTTYRPATSFARSRSPPCDSIPRTAEAECTP